MNTFDFCSYCTAPQMNVWVVLRFSKVRRGENDDDPSEMRNVSKQTIIRMKIANKNILILVPTGS